ncbi:MAG: LysR family transcriptional regulator [Rhodobacteraceae bacterium]|nr:LysR family transcriptional regulator [Paracoccaceae bacterium]
MTPALDWAELPYFLAVARTGSLRAAADLVGGTHATVDRHLRTLETAYGVRLFERATTGLTLTPAGESLLPKAEEAELAVISARRRIEGLDKEAAGTVRVTAPPFLAYDVLAPIFARFCSLHPEIDLDVTLTDRFQDLTRSEADVSIRVAFEVSDDVIGRRVLQYASAIYASRDYLAKHWDKRGAKGEGLHWIGWGDATVMPDWVRDSPFPRATLRHAVNDGLLVKSLVQQGMGLSYLPCFVQEYAPGLVQVPDTKAELERSIWLLLHADLRQTTRVRLFVDYAAKELKSLRAEFLGPLANT